MIAALLLTQCTKRKNPVDVNEPGGLYFTVQIRSAAIENDIMQDPPYRSVQVYTPPGYNASDTTTRYPVLYLLHGYGGTDTYFRGLFGLKESMDDMINSGKIKPMLVVTPDASNQLGGGFYTNSPDINGTSYAGRMQDFITNEVVAKIDSTFNTIPDRAHRAIAGHSMGGYGAIKIAMLRPDLFCATASMSAPLSFWGNMPNPPEGVPQFKGIFELIGQVFAENNGVPGDVAVYNSITPGPGKRVTNMMFAMAASFSPHDPATPSQYAHRFTTQTFSGYVDLPFDSSGAPAMSVWSRWMANDVLAIFAGGGAGVFDSTALYFDAGNADDLGLQYHAQVFEGAIQVANAYGMHIAYKSAVYAGDDAWYPADHTMWIGERIKDVVAFSDSVFNK